MHNLTIEQMKKLSRACTALRMGINKGHVTLAGARVLLAGNATNAAGQLGLTLTRRNGVTTHDLDDARVVWFLSDCLEARKIVDVTNALRDLRDDCHSAINVANMA